MKKILFILCIFSCVAHAEIFCEDAGGTLFRGNDGETEYCLSFHGMNWWSANAWCQALGLELVDLQTECKKKGASIVATSACPQLTKFAFSNRYGWTKNTPSSSTAIRIYVGQGSITTQRKDSSAGALCLVK